MPPVTTGGSRKQWSSGLFSTLAVKMRARQGETERQSDSMEGRVLVKDVSSDFEVDGSQAPRRREELHRFLIGWLLRPRWPENQISCLTLCSDVVPFLVSES